MEGSDRELRRQRLFDRALVAPAEIRELTADALHGRAPLLDQIDALIAWGWADYGSGRLGQAAEWIEKAHQLVARESDAIGQARTDVARLEAAILSAEGRVDDAETVLRRVIASHPNLNHARLYSSLGQVHAARGDLDAAIGLVQQGLAQAAKYGDRRTEAALLVNRAVARMERAEFTTAEEDLAVAQDLAVDLGEDAVRATAAHNLGVIMARRGDLRRAIVLFDTAAEFLSRSGGMVALAHAFLDQSLLLLDAGLIEEAGTKARSSLALFERLHSDQYRVEALHQLARIAAADGRWAEAAELARSALGLVESAGSKATILDQARHEVQRYELVASMERSGSQELTAADLAAARVQTIHVGTLVDGAAVLQHGGDNAAARHLLEACISSPGTSTPRRLERQVATALLAELDGHADQAFLAAQVGLEEADAYADTLGISELRAMTERRVGQLAAVGLRHGLQQGDPLAIVRTLEQQRRITLHAEPPASDTELGGLTRLRAINRLMVDTAESDSALVRERQELEARLRERRRRASQSLPGVPRTELNIVPDSTVYLFRLGDTLHAIGSSSGEVTLTPIGSCAEIRRKLRALQLTLAASASPAVDLPVTRLIESARDVLRALLEPLSKLERVTVVPEPSLPTFPWALLTTSIVTLVPSLELYMHVQRPKLPAIGKVALFAGPDLLAADAEVESAAGVTAAAHVYVGSEASAENALREFSESSLVHFATHGSFRSDNPLLSSVRLADGPLTFYELLAGASPSRLVFSACDVGRAAASSALGIAPLLLSRGCREILASTGPTGDAAACELMTRIYRNLADSPSLSDALGTAQREMVDEHPSVSLFAAFGASGGP